MRDCRQRGNYLDDDGFRQLQGALMANPEAGDLIDELTEGFDALADQRTGKRTLRTHASKAKPAPKITARELAKVRKDKCERAPLIRLALAMIFTVRPVAPSAAPRVPFYKVLGTVWLPGLGLAFSSVGFGAITAFIALLFAARSWGNASLAFTSFGVAFIGARLLFGHLPDKLGGARVALVCVVIEAVGQLLIWDAARAATVHLGAALTGFGYSLAFPSFGVEAVKRAPPQSRGMAMGAYVAFLDISLGIAGPATGAIANAKGVNAVYMASTLAVTCAIAVALLLWASKPRATQQPAPARVESRYDA